MGGCRRNGTKAGEVQPEMGRTGGGGGKMTTRRRMGTRRVKKIVMMTMFVPSVLD